MPDIHRFRVTSTPKADRLSVMSILRGVILLLCCAVPVTASAQGFVLRPQIDVTPISNTLGGYDYHLTAVEADPAIAGKEILFWVPGLWMFSVGRWHPTKHGAYGSLPGPGLCLEPWTFLVPRGPVWHFQSVGDFYGNDGIDDFLVYIASGQIDPYQGVGLNLCK